MKKDFKGDTPLHIAAKSGSTDILEFYMQTCTPSFLEVENDFGFTPKVALMEKLMMLKE